VRWIEGCTTSLTRSGSAIRKLAVRVPVVHEGAELRPGLRIPSAAIPLLLALTSPNPASRLRSSSGSRRMERLAGWRLDAKTNNLDVDRVSRFVWDSLGEQ